MLHNVIVLIGIKIYKWSIHITGCHFVLYLSVQIGFLFKDNELENKVILYMVMLLGVNLVRKMALKTKVHKKKETRFQEKKNETTYI